MPGQQLRRVRSFGGACCQVAGGFSSAVPATDPTADIAAAFSRTGSRSPSPATFKILAAINRSCWSDAGPGKEASAHSSAFDINSIVCGPNEGPPNWPWSNSSIIRRAFPRLAVSSASRFVGAFCEASGFGSDAELPPGCMSLSGTNSSRANFKVSRNLILPLPGGHLGKCLESLYTCTDVTIPKKSESSKNPSLSFFRKNATLLIGQRFDRLYKTSLPTLV
jgi:hypothetical protein